MSTVRINLDRRHHDDNPRLRPFIEKGEATLTICFGKRGKIKIKAWDNDVRNLAKDLNRLVDSHEVANGKRVVQP